MANQNQKWKSRRFFVTVAAIGLITIAFYLIIFLCRHDAEIFKLGRDMFADYSFIIFGSAGILVGGLSWTDFAKVRKNDDSR